MRYEVRPEVFDKVPDFVRAVIAIDGADNSSSDSPLAPLLRERIQRVEREATQLLNGARIEAWSRAHGQFPKPSGERVRPSVTNLVRRIERGGGDRIPFVSPLVAISNLVALSYVTPSGLVDRDTVRGDLVLGPASGKEMFCAFGREEAVPVTPGEIIYYDALSGDVMCRGWNSLGGRATGISPGTTRAVLDIDCLTSVLPLDLLDAAVAEAVGWLREHCGADCTTYVLSASSPRIDLPD